MDEKKLKALASELAKGLKTEVDLNQFSAFKEMYDADVSPTLISKVTDARMR